MTLKQHTARFKAHPPDKLDLLEDEISQGRSYYNAYVSNNIEFRLAAIRSWREDCSGYSELRDKVRGENFGDFDDNWSLLNMETTLKKDPFFKNLRHIFQERQKKIAADHSMCFHTKALYRERAEKSCGDWGWISLRWHKPSKKFAYKWPRQRDIFDRDSVGIQINDGAGAKTTNGCINHSKLRVEQLKIKRNGCAVLRIWLNLSREREPRWISFIAYCSQWSMKCCINEVVLVREKVGNFYEYYGFFVFRDKEKEDDRATDGWFVYDKGWASSPEGRTMLTCRDHCGREWEESLPQELIDRDRFCSNLKAKSDNAFNQKKQDLSKFLGEQILPEWLTEITGSIDKWRGHDRLQGVFHRWNEQRFDGDENMYRSLEAWATEDLRLRHKIARLTRKNQRWRLNVHREIVARLRRQYATAVGEDLPNNDKVVAQASRHLCAIGQLVSMIRSGCRDQKLLDHRNTTRRCHQCQEICKVPKGYWREHSCEHCGATWHRDINSVRNMAREHNLGHHVKENKGKASRKTQKKTMTNVTMKTRLERIEKMRSELSPLASSRLKSIQDAI